MRRSCPDEHDPIDPEYEELRRRALEPFMPTLTMEDVLRHEERIRAASIEYLKEEGKRAKQCKKDEEIERASYIPPMDYEIQYDF